MFLTGSTSIASGGWSQTSGVVKWTLTIGSGTGYVTAYSAASPSLNVWYSVELHWKRDSVNGLGELYVNGVLVASITGRNTASYPGVNTVRFGLSEISGCAATTAYADDCAISRVYVGPSSTSDEQPPEIPIPGSTDETQAGSQPTSSEPRPIKEWIAFLISIVLENQHIHS
jgi:hypothetical protein